MQNKRLTLKNSNVSSRRLKDAIALHHTLRIPHANLPRPSHDNPPYTLHTPLWDIIFFFSYASFRDINCRLQEPLSCVPERKMEGARNMEHTLGMCVCSLRSCSSVCLRSALKWAVRAHACVLWYVSVSECWCVIFTLEFVHSSIHLGGYICVHVCL